ncbi:MAG: ATP cone domain-containing protein [Candidatus Heimdallarchaeaceae archaeon]|jgi:2-phosphoglycerate kinase
MSFEPQIYIKGKPNQIFSKGLLAKKLELFGLPLSEGYEFSLQVFNELVKKGNNEIQKEDLDNIVIQLLKEKYTPKLAKEYSLVEKWRESSTPLWLLIAGAIGVGKSTLSRKIAGDLGIQHVIGTGVVREILRKILSPDVMPELHSQSYTAYQSLRPIYSSRFEEVILGFENHSKFVNIGLDAVLSRADTESVSIVVEGEHLLPAFFDETILQKPNVLYLTIAVPDPSLHKDNLSAQYTKEKEELLSHFEDIRKIHEHLVNETKVRKLPLILSERGKEPIGEVRELVVDKIVSLVSSE